MIDGQGGLLGAEAIRRLTDQRRIDVEPGLTEVELDAVEQRFGFQFADDHRGFLAAGLPVGRGWPNWRDGRDEHLREHLAWPVDGVLFDVEHNVFCHSDWGVRPAVVADALAVARERLATVPRMVPVYSHRYLPAGRGSLAHPVLSMYQTDIIVYGLELVDYIYQELVARRAGEFMRRYRRSHNAIGIADYLIAATAELHGQQLATLNVRHFPMFADLRPPFEVP